MIEPSAKVVCDSVSPLGYRVTTMEVVMHRFVLAEFNTHRVFSRNSASSRAIPVKKQLKKVKENPAWPLYWGAEQPGMQSGGELEGADLEAGRRLFTEAHRGITLLIEDYLASIDAEYPDETPEERKAHTLHKSLINRLIEPFMWHTAIVTSVEWQNFYNQRSSEYSPLAQKEIQATADAMLIAQRESTPRRLAYGEWHLPYIQVQDWGWAYRAVREKRIESALEALKKVSTARCARVSYLTQAGARDLTEDINLYERLMSASPRHESPREHPATPATQEEIDAGEVYGNLPGFHQHRHEVST